MNKQVLILIASVTLLACATTDPQLDYVPAPSPPPAQVENSGPWRVALISVRSAEKATRLRMRFAEKGYRVEIEPVEIEGESWQRLVFPGQFTREDAQDMQARLEQEFEITGSWIPLPTN